MKGRWLVDLQITNVVTLRMSIATRTEGVNMCGHVPGMSLCSGSFSVLYEWIVSNHFGEQSMDIILSTRNPSKAEQIRALFAGTPFTVLTLADAGIEGEAVEDGETLEENALKKARFAHKLGSWSMADDTGLFITALNGAPGIHAARWAGDAATTAEITQHTLRSLEGKTDRSAVFRTTVALVDPSGAHHFFSGEVHGDLLEAQRVPAQPKMPYSGIFVLRGTGRVWAEMSVDEENAVSHRGIAFRKVLAFLTPFAG